MTNIFITGATGLLGWNLAKELLGDKAAVLYLLVRGNGKGNAEKRILDLVARDFSAAEIPAIKSRIKVIEGDIVYKDLGVDKEMLKALYVKIDKIYHCAAVCEFAVPLEEIRKTNVAGAKNVLDFALKCRTELFGHISTVGVAGKSGGAFYEDSLDMNQEFNNTYEQSKFEAEKLMHDYKKQGLPIKIFRPAIIVGDSVNGRVNDFQMFYQFLHFLSLGLIDEIPFNSSMEYNITPVDYVAKAIAKISSKGSSCDTFQLAHKKGISFDFFLEAAVDYFGFKRPEMVSMEEYDYNKLSGFRKKILDIYLPYLIHEKITYDSKNFDFAINGNGFIWPEIDRALLMRLFKYCDKVGYIKKQR